MANLVLILQLKIRQIAECFIVEDVMRYALAYLVELRKTANM